MKRELGARDRMEWNRGPEPDWPDKVRNWNSWPEAQGQGAWGEADHADGEADGEVRFGRATLFVVTIVILDLNVSDGH